MKHNLLYVIFLAIVLCASCSGGKDHDTLLLAEEQVTKSADSCDILLQSIDTAALHGEDKALYGLVSSWLLYRQYAKEIPEEPLQRAFSFYHDSKDSRRRAQVYFLRAVIHQDLKRGQPSEWMEDLYSACLAIEQTEDYLLASQIYQNYSAQFTHLRRYDDARPWVDRFVEAARLSGNANEYVQALICKSENCMRAEMAHVQQKLGTVDGKEIARRANFDEGFAAIYKALAIAREKNLKVALGRIYTQLSVCHSNSQNLDSLLYYAKLSVLTNEELHAEGLRKEATNYLTLSDAYRKLGQADSAVYYATKTFTTPGTPLRNKQVAAHLLYNIYADVKHDYKMSMEWMRRYNQLTDSVNQTTVATNIKAVQDAAVKEQEKSSLKEEKRQTLDWLLWSIAIGAVAVIGILLLMVRNRRRYNLLLQEKEAEFNRMIEDMRKGAEEVKTSSDVVSEETPAAASVIPEDVTLVGTTKEKVCVKASSILFIMSDSNYIKVFYLDEEGRIQSRMLRQTMTSIESQLKDYPHIVRCHRAFIVNLHHARSAKSTSSGLLLTLDATSEQVPVSKTYLSFIKERLG